MSYFTKDELEEAMADSSLEVTYNVDGSYVIKEKEIEEEYEDTGQYWLETTDIIFEMYCALNEYCESQSLPLLDTGTSDGFANFLTDIVPELKKMEKDSNNE